MKILTWDSDFFGFNVSRIDLCNTTDASTEEEETCHTQSVLTYLFSKQKLEEDTLLDYKGILVDRKLLFEKRITNFKISNNSLINIEEYGNKFAKKKMYQLAYLSGEFSRFNVDPNLSRTNLCRENL